MPMNIDNQYILIVEDEALLRMLYEDALEEVGFKQDVAPFDYQLDGWVVHFAANKEQAAEHIKRFVYEVVYLDHDLGNGKTSASLVPQLLRASPNCELFLASSNPEKQSTEVLAELTKANMAALAAQLKSHNKNDVRGFIAHMNSKIRPANHLPAGEQPSPKT
ncbi:MAG: hypothetical protein SFW65_09610 [Alphaproteobacteria bacterium]|nr:hypothetical protein [Alphaproteobacteria bacterium]